MFEFNNEEKFNIGDLVIKNEDTWVENSFDIWGRGIGIGIIVEPPFKLNDNFVDVKWPNGRCFEYTDYLLKYNSASN